MNINPFIYHVYVPYYLGKRKLISTKLRKAAECLRIDSILRVVIFIFLVNVIAKKGFQKEDLCAF